MSHDEHQVSSSVTNPAPRFRRRWWSLSVRGLMLLVLVVGGLIGWQVNRVTRMRRAVAVLVRNPTDPPDYRPPGDTMSFTIGGSPSRTEITYDDDFQDLPIPAWLHRGLRWALGDDSFRNVSGLNLSRPPSAADWEAIEALGSVEQLELTYFSLNDENLDRLAKCPRLYDLSLRGSKLPSRRLAGVGALRNLRSLDLFKTNATAADLAPLANLSLLEELTLPPAAGIDAGLLHLQGLRNLQTLDVLGSVEGAVTDVGLSYLRGMTQLQSLRFNAHHVTDEGMAVLEALPRLASLEIHPAWADIAGALTLSPTGVARLDRFTHLTTLKLTTQETIDDTWLVAISRLAALRELQIAGDRITDAGLIPLAKLTELADLWISGQHVTDAGLRHLYPLTRLKSLGLLANVSDAGVASLQAALPTLKTVANTQWPKDGGLLPAPTPPFGLPAPRPLAPLALPPLFKLAVPPDPPGDKP